MSSYLSPRRFYRKSYLLPYGMPPKAGPLFIYAVRVSNASIMQWKSMRISVKMKIPKMKRYQPALCQKRGEYEAKHVDDRQPPECAGP